jgi:hypothetical protein
MSSRIHPFDTNNTIFFTSSTKATYFCTSSLSWSKFLKNIFYQHTASISCNLFMLVRFQDVVNGIEFASGGPKTTWGSVRAAMGHPEPFKLDYVSIGNQECWMLYYRGWQIIQLYCTLFIASF